MVLPRKKSCSVAIILIEEPEKMKITAWTALMIVCLSCGFAMLSSCKSGRNYTQEGMKAEAKGDIQSAIELYTDAIEAEDLDLKGSTIVFTNRGNLYFKKGLYEKALDDYDEASSRYPYYPQTYYQRGLLYGALGEYKRAIRDFSRAIDYRMEYSKQEYPDAYFARGNAYGRLGKLKRAIGDYDKSISLRPKTSHYHLKRGVVYFAMGKKERALSDFEKARALYKFSAIPIVYQGAVYYAYGDYDKAAVYFAMAQKQDPKNALAAIWLHLAQWRGERLTRSGATLADVRPKSGWHAQLIDMLTEKITPEELENRSKSDNPMKTRSQAHSAAFYTGEFHLLKSGSDAARIYFNKCLKVIPHAEIESVIAGMELERLKQLK